MGLPRVSLGGVQVRMRQSLFTFRHWTFRGEPGAPGFSAAASETQGRGREESRGGSSGSRLLGNRPPPVPTHHPLLINPRGGLSFDLEDQDLNDRLFIVYFFFSSSVCLVY